MIDALLFSFQLLMQVILQVTILMPDIRKKREEGLFKKSGSIFLWIDISIYYTTVRLSYSIYHFSCWTAVLQANWLWYLVGISMEIAQIQLFQSHRYSDTIVMIPAVHKNPWYLMGEISLSQTVGFWVWLPTALIMLMTASIRSV